MAYTKSAKSFPSLCSWSAVEAHRCQLFANRHLSRLVSEKWCRCRWVCEVQLKERASAFHHPMHKIAEPLPLSLHFAQEWKLSLVAEWALAQCYHTNQEISYAKGRYHQAVFLVAHTSKTTLDGDACRDYEKSGASPLRIKPAPTTAAWVPQSTYRTDKHHFSEYAWFLSHDFVCWLKYLYQ